MPGHKQRMERVSKYFSLKEELKQEKIKVKELERIIGVQAEEINKLKKKK